MGLSRTIIVGRMAGDPESKYLDNDKMVCNFRVAVQRVSKNREGGYDADFYSVTAWDKTAAYVEKYLTKGRLVSVEGRMESRKYTPQGSDKAITVWELKASSVEGLDRAPEGDDEDRGERRSSQQSRPAGRQQGGGSQRPGNSRQGNNQRPANNRRRDDDYDDSDDGFDS